MAKQLDFSDDGRPATDDQKRRRRLILLADADSCFALEEIDLSNEARA